MTKRIVVRHNVPTECLLNNIIDEDFQTALFPLGINQILFSTSNYRITGNFITPNRNIDYIKYFIGATVFIFANYYRFIANKTIFESSLTPTLRFLLWFDCIDYGIVDVFIYIFSAFHGSNTVLLIIKLQQIFRAMNFNKATIMSEMKFWNWINVICLYGFYFVYNLPLSLVSTTFGYFVMTSVTLIFDFNMIYASRSVTFVHNALAMWNNKMVYYEKAQLQQNQGIEDTLTGTVMVNAYRDIFRTFRLTEQVYQFGIFCFAMATFNNVLISIQTIIEFYKLDSELATVYASPYAWVFTALWIVKNFALILSLSIACDKFYKSVAEADAFCTKTLEIEESDLRKTCKNVLRLNRAAFRKLSAFGVFAVDAALPLRLLVAVLAYTVVLLQFAFL